MIVAAGSVLGDFKKPYMKWGVYTCTNALTGAIAGLVAHAVEASSRPGIAAVAMGTFGAVIVANGVDMLFGAATAKMRGNGALRMLRDVAPVLPTVLVLQTAVVMCLAYAFAEISPWSMLMFLLPLAAAHRLFVMYQTQRDLADNLVKINDKLEDANTSFASALVAALDARDRYTAGHSAAVAVYARDIATHLGLSSEEQRVAHLAGLLHDIGKIGVPTGILEKPGPLTLSERRQMERHSEIGQRILENVEAYAEISIIVRHHHERLDGLGYPDGLEGTEIPLISRILCVADAYNAMTSDRPYRDAMPAAIARDRLRESAGTQFDASVVRAFEAVLDREGAEYAAGQSVSFAAEMQAHPHLIAA